MRKLYINLPSLKELEKLIKDNFLQSETLTEADIVVSEGELDFITGKLIITIADKPSDANSVFINRNLSTEAIYQALSAAIETYTITAGPMAINQSYYVLKDSDPKVGYLIKKLENILNSAAESIIEIDHYGSILFHNKRFAQTYGSDSSVVDGNIFNMFDANTVRSLKTIMTHISTDEPMEFFGKIRNAKGELLSLTGYISALPGNISHYEIIFEDVTEKMRMLSEAKKLEEQSIIAGFARHLSHNVMNALTAAGGFIRQVRAKTENTLHLQNLWHIIDDKLVLIEEIVAGYNDYTHATSIRKTENLDFDLFFKELIDSIAEKKVDRIFSAYLYKFTENYNLTCDFSESSSFVEEANKMFLKLALCYILKDNIRYFNVYLPLEYKLKVKRDKDTFNISILVANVEVSEQIVDTMLKPWDHKMLSQSFDYWGIMIAAAVIENHNGKLDISCDGNRLCFNITFKKS